MNYRNPAVLQEAQNHPCQLCGANDGSVVAAHSNQSVHGKGMALKANDWAVAYLCSICHHQIDQGFLYTKHQKQQLWNQAHKKSVPLFIHLLDEETKQLLENANV